MRNYQLSKLNQKLMEQSKKSGKINSFKQMAVNKDGRLIDATRDVTERDLSMQRWYNLKTGQGQHPNPVDRKLEAIALEIASFRLLVLMIVIGVGAYILIHYVI